LEEWFVEHWNLILLSLVRGVIMAAGCCLVAFWLRTDQEFIFSARQNNEYGIKFNLETVSII